MTQPEVLPARRSRLAATVVVAIAAAVALLASLFGVASALLPRSFTAAQQRSIMAWEVAGRWQTWPAGRIFPARAGYRLPAALLEGASGLSVTATRVGITAPARCAAVTDQPLARVLDARGCEAVLRATYVDSTGSFVVTIGVAVMRGNAPALRSLPHGRRLAPGVRAAPFPRTLAARFYDPARQLSGSAGYGPYLVLYTAGYADGRRRDRMSADPYAESELRDLGAGLARDIGSALGAQPPVPRCPGAPGC